MRSYLAFLLLATTGCNGLFGPTAEERLEARVKQELATAPKTNDAFLTFQYGDTKETLQLKASQLIAQRQVEAAESPTMLAAYRFTDPIDLVDVTWWLSPSFHNDTLVSLSMYSYFTEKPDLDELHSMHRSLLDKYQAVYGQPIVLTDGEHVFLKGEKKITIKQDEEFRTLNVNYENSRLEKYRLNLLNKPGTHFDKAGNSYDAQHWAAHEKDQPPVDPNPDKI